LGRTGYNSESETRRGDSISLPVTVAPPICGCGPGLPEEHKRRRLRHNGCMVKSVEGVYRNGKVELLEPLAEAEGSRVIVTWVPPAVPVDLRQRGIDEAQAADLRRRLSPFAEDWNRPEMAAYDELPPR